MVTMIGIIIHKIEHKKGRRGMTMKFIEKLFLLPKTSYVNMVDLGYLVGVEKDFTGGNYIIHYLKRRREIRDGYPMGKKNTTKIILKKE